MESEQWRVGEQGMAWDEVDGVSYWVDGVSYWYEGRCPQSGALLRLPRTRSVEALAQDLWENLARDEGWTREGKMYGVLVAESKTGDRQVLKAFSGLIRGEAIVPGWVPPLPGRSSFVQAEVNTLLQLETLKQELIQLQSSPVYSEFEALEKICKSELETLDAIHAERKRDRDRQRQELEINSLPDQIQRLNNLQWQSRQDSTDRRKLRQQHRDRLAPLRQSVQKINDRIQAIKQERKALSQQLQLQMHQAYQLTNFLGLSTSLRSLMPQGAPTGTGECCAPKLLHHAATLGLKPVAMAEFWWGEEKGGRSPGTFYGACATRCQPMMGFLLAGTQSRSLDFPILYEDDDLIAIDKPSGLLSVPGRGSDRIDSAWVRLQSLYPDSQPVHRLDQDTSGILLFAKTQTIERELRRAFEDRSVTKIYEAVLDGTIPDDSGTIDLPLWGDPTQRPYQTVNTQYGKPSITQFEVIDRSAQQTRVTFYPLTGRTHQLRVHAASGLGAPIVGDRLYSTSEHPRLLLHARQLEFIHPGQGQGIKIRSQTPF